MDPVAHTLFGATLAEIGLKRISRYSAATLVIGSNLPDIDGVSMLWGMDTSLYFRRGWTHGILAFVILPLLLAGVFWLWHRWRGGGVGVPEFRIWKVLGLSYLAVLSHPALDWLNTYGVRLLMPFDDRWFYGDTLFIVDPWFWLLMVVAVVLAHSSSVPVAAGWGLLAVFSTALIVFSGVVSMPVKVMWMTGLAGIVVLRSIKPDTELTKYIARGCVLSLAVYISAVYWLARSAETAVAERFSSPQISQANPVPGVSFAHRIVMVYERMYRIVRPDGSTIELERREPDRVVQAAFSDPSVRGFTIWMRYPYWEVTEVGDGWTVTLYDLRYSEPGQPPIGIGQVNVFVPHHAVSGSR